MQKTKEPMQMRLQLVVQRADACAEVFAESCAVPRAVVCAVDCAELRAENRLNRSFCPIDITHCNDLAHIWLDKVQNCADAEKFAETVQPQRGSLFIEGYEQTCPVAPAERKI